MNKIVAIFLLLGGLIVFANAKDIPIQVGGDDGENVFVPAKVIADSGDNLVFTWKTGKHSVIESDAPKSCAKSIRPSASFSGGAFVAPKTWTAQVTIESGKTWFYCGVPGHCITNEGGMVVSIVVGNDGTAKGGDAAKANAGGKTAGGKGKTGKTTGGDAKTVEDGATASPGSGSSGTLSTVGIVMVVIVSVIGGILLTIGSYFLYKMYKKKKLENEKIMLIAGDDSSNNRQTPVSENISKNQNMPEVYNHGREATPTSEYNGLRNYIVQVVRQEITQNPSR